jgi:ketosteroid isomerase-like protein
MTQVVSPSDLVRGVFAALDAKDADALAARMSEDVRLRLGNQDVVEGKAAFLATGQAFASSINGIRHEIHWNLDDVVIVEMDFHYERLDGGRLTFPCCKRDSRAAMPDVLDALRA